LESAFGKDEKLYRPYPFRSRFRAWKSGFGQAYLGGGPVVVTFDTEEFDGLNEYDNVVTNGFISQQAGYYYINTRVQPANLVLWDITQLDISDVAAGLNICHDQTETINAAVNWTVLKCVGIFYLTPANLVQVFFNNTSPCIIAGGRNTCFFEAHRLS
jgi:hypothetical protein